jgi:hypothetical protein
LTLKISGKHVVAAGAAVSLAAALYLFGITGGRTLLGIVLFFFLPFYLILRRFAFEQDEKIFFAFFIGIGIFSTLVFYVGRVVPSFRASAAIAFVALVLISFAARKFVKK